MTIDLLQQFFGTNPQLRREYADFMQRYQDDPGSISAAEAARRYRELLRHTPPDLAAEAHDYSFAQLAPEHRRELAERFRSAADDPQRPFNGCPYPDTSTAARPGNLGRMASQAEQQDPSLLEQLLVQESPLSSPPGRVALASVAAYLTSRAIGQGGMAQPELSSLERGGTDKRI
jgi:hypothetical protein